MRNRLLEPIEYKTETTPLGVWKSFGYETGMAYHEFTSHATVLGMPLIHHTRGICPETGRRKTARGFLAFGKVAVGVIAVGHMSFGVLAVGQAAFGLLGGLGQLTTGAFALGQVAFGVCVGVGQLATGYIAMGQFALGEYVLAQVGVGDHVFSQKINDPAAREFFSRLPILKSFFQ